MHTERAHEEHLCKPFQGGGTGRDAAVESFREHLITNGHLQDQIIRLSGKRLLCHCRENRRCHGDILVKEFQRQFPLAHDRGSFSSRPQTSEVLDLHARYRERPRKDLDGKARVHLWKSERDTPPLLERLYPESPLWQEARDRIMKFSDRFGTQELLPKTGPRKGGTIHSTR